MAPKILMIVTSSSRMGNTDKPTGLWAEELAVPYYALVDAGASVVIGSTAGGKAPIDAGSVKAKGANDPDVERMLADDSLLAQIERTFPVSELRSEDFDAVFFPGGHGTMWDLPTDQSVKVAVESAFENGRLIASVCHGAAGLVSAVRSDGLPMVHGKRVNSFTDAEEVEVGLAGVVPFMLETRLRELGGVFEGGDNWQPFAIRDGQLITGQNPQSSAKVAEILIEALGIKA
ncbi:type 1 glutamine amidotransferase domain-containing protein [Pseudomonas juntendi]|uniref:Type 1 glutamine amidotransferase domain-containing protein n=1 Tax=Pseudomonas juntendi TaxID=2666183 RepID=A0AAJ5S3Q3_9PSED|nr:type 1 glutamine amidotransferase domain-containing protein [Pseudomonas juntendi]MDM3891138.1 type 1 glutamine amidotransferase domain-containing protein [Pseudomonas juntendi]QOH70181.1 type 1 glutamine amidotransferase domain-containing protein [Pseudomonas putida]WEA22403.1 type 1 glutamine amidotransferase domain-containing protein [Pseudomonas juntendi]